jgi:hypothetical protein
MKGWHMMDWLILEAMRLQRKNETIIKRKHLATRYTSPASKVPNLNFILSTAYVQKHYLAQKITTMPENSQLRVITQSLVSASLNKILSHFIVPLPLFKGAKLTSNCENLKPTKIINK